MYAYIRGQLAETGPDSIVIEAGGIGYRVHIPGKSLNYLPQIGAELKVYTYLHTREDAMILYGFFLRDDLELFKQLITVSGIGPKGGLAVLSALNADELRFAVLSGDAKAIAKAPGIGAKTAQRVILELKDRLSLEEAFEKKSQGAASSEGLPQIGQVKEDAVLALTALGYSSTESLRAVSGVEITEDMDLEAVLKAALKRMSLM